MAAFQFRIDERDQETYGGPEWATFDEDALADTEFDELLAIEKELGRSVKRLWVELNTIESGVDLRDATWLARRLSGVSEPRETFKPRPLRIEYRLAPAGDDVGPPAQASSEASPTQ